ncbi:MAG: Riboflavin biosynthesis protein RibF [Acidimicrobiales bacterium]|nr:MAG: bifunctional riboflavin kinase/FAD synthetase [Actinomycetota bacterium]MBV6509170.1 Riboflavin biosynthesis protein RibF [Acidimicrobiales bacterium]RIK08484.1 MAG: bifunctional riboflavin kinase/FAD synthetase [Acidobacteriota bacterium]
MEVIRDLQACPRPVDGTALTIGAYDGVHLGHRAVISAVRSHASRQGTKSAVVTFDRHPAQVVRPDSAPFLLTSLDQKLELLASTGVDYTLVITFNESRAKEPPEDFVMEVLVDCMNTRLVVVGQDFHFGHQRRGNVALLRELGQANGFSVIGHHLVDRFGHDARDDTLVSSTAIRRALHDGRLNDANALLGRPHEMRGPVVRGDGRGRELGFPTANIAIAPEMLMPADGIYAGWYDRPGGDTHPAAIYIGTRPTFYANEEMSLLEAHLLDFDGDLYGEMARVHLIEQLRGDKAFDTAEALARQLRVDCEDARVVLGA